MPTHHFNATGTFDGQAVTVSADVTIVPAVAAPPVWVSSGDVSVLSGKNLTHTLQATGTDFSHFGPFEGVDVSHFETFGSTLRWMDDDVRHLSAPLDVGGNNVYDGSISAILQDGQSTPRTHTISVLTNPDEPAQITGLTIPAATITTTQAVLSFAGAGAYQYRLNGAAALDLAGNKTITGLLGEGQRYLVQVREKHVASSSYGRWSAEVEFYTAFSAPLDVQTATGLDEVDRNTYTFVGLATGPATSSGYAKTGMLVKVWTQAAIGHLHGGAATFVSVGGVNGVKVANFAAANTLQFSQWLVPYTSAAAANVVVPVRNASDTALATAIRCMIEVIAIYGRSLTVVSSAVKTLSPFEITLTVPDDNVAFFAAAMASGTDEVSTWGGGAQKTHEAFSVNLQASGAFYRAPVDQTPTFPVSWTGVPANQRLHGFVLGPSSPAAIGIAAVWADDMKDFVGVGGHINFDLGAGGQVWNATTGVPWVPKWAALGARYMRTHLAGNQPQTRNYMNQLNTAYGTKFLLVSNRVNQATRVYDHAAMRSDVDAASTYAAQILAGEGPNEVNQGGSPNGAGITGWEERTFAYQKELFERWNDASHVPLNAKPLLQSTIYGRSDVAIDSLSAYRQPGAPTIGISNFADIATLHVYYGGLAPELSRVPIVGSEDGAPGTVIPIERAMERARILTPDPKPLWTTEEGYSVTDATNPIAYNVHSDRCAAKYHLRAILEHWQRRGSTGIGRRVAKIFPYGLIDDIDVNDNYGLLRPNTGTNPKTVTERIQFQALKNFLDTLEDGGGPGGLVAPTLGSLNIGFTGNLANFSYVLAQKRPGSSTGKFYIIAWLRVPSWGSVGGVYQDVETSRSITFNFGQVPSAAVRSAEPVRALDNTMTWATHSSAQSQALTVKDHPLFIEFTP